MRARVNISLPWKEERRRDWPGRREFGEGLERTEGGGSREGRGKRKGGELGGGPNEKTNRTLEAFIPECITMDSSSISHQLQLDNNHNKYYYNYDKIKVWIMVMGVVQIRGVVYVDNGVVQKRRKQFSK